MSAWEVWKVFLELTPRLGALAASPEDIMYLLKSLSRQINIQFQWTRKLAPLTVIFLVSCQPRFHAALFKYIFRSTKVDFVVGGAVASWLVRSAPERAVRVRALAGDIVLRSWARHFTLIVPLSTQVYKWVPANCWGNLAKLRGSDLRWTSIPSREVGNTSSRFMLQKPG